MCPVAAETVLVTGGAGFIGSHLVDRLVTSGWNVRVLDSLEPQVHGASQARRNSAAEYQQGTVLDPEAVRRALSDADHVIHLAAQVGVGQSMYEVERYVSENCVGTGVLLDRVVEQRDRIRTLVVASSMSIYGEGRYECGSCGLEDPDGRRSLQQLEDRSWEPMCPQCSTPLSAVPTPETQRLRPDSVYAVTKRDQEELCLAIGKAYGVRTVALRFFNAYGPRQSLSNPYTGVAAIFASRLLNRQAPLVFEDGQQSRDFVHVSDIVQGIELALVNERADSVALNLGTGRPTTVLEVAGYLARELDIPLEPEIIGQFRHGDIRHCYGDIQVARDLLEYEPRVGLAEGFRELAAWIASEAPPALDRVSHSTEELTQHGLVI